MNDSIPKILLIDDDDNVHVLLRYHLERAGFGLISAKAMQEALDTIQNEDSLLVVLVDINLPRADVGWALLGKLAKLKQTKLANTAIVVYSIDDDISRAKAAGADEHLVKPINHKEIIAVIEKYAVQRSKADDQ
jgi:CheY-like chemotaxis protein